MRHQGQARISINTTRAPEFDETTQDSRRMQAYRRDMTATALPADLLQASFAEALPELAVPWQAADAPQPRLLALNEPLVDELGLNPDHLRSPEGLQFLVGTNPPAGATPVAQAYAGHQFGVYVPRLGVGRALLLGEFTGRDGRLQDLHLKGSGPTPFAGGGDGFAAVGPMLREFLISEALHALGVPTTRSLAVVGTGRPVLRERPLPGAVLARVADSHLRVGSFQFARATGDVGLLRRLADYAITRHHPGAAEHDHRYLGLFEAVMQAQAELVAASMSIGFVHGVLNTDNTTISGQSIDYGPCAFMEGFDPATVFSSIDHAGRYAYGNQPAVIQWNLARFAETLLPLLDPDQDKAIEIATASLGTFADRYRAAWIRRMRTKLGLGDEMPDDDAAALINDLTSILTATEPDFTVFFRRLTEAAEGDEGPVRALLAGDGTPAGNPEALETRMQATVDFSAWLARWRSASPDPKVMARANPVYIPRNHLVDEALEAATTADLEPFNQLLAVIREPFSIRPGLERYERPAPAESAPFVSYCGT